MMAEDGNLTMSDVGMIGDEIDEQARRATAAFQGVSQPSGEIARPSLTRAAIGMLGPYSAALYLAERVIESSTFNLELVQVLHSKILPLERMADQILLTARQHGYFDNPEIAEALRWLETCNGQLKDCMVSLESMMDPKLDDLMVDAIEEQRRRETVPLDLIA